MNNAVFGKIMENIRKHKEIKLEQQEKEKAIWYLTQIITLHSFSQKNCWL